MGLTADAAVADAAAAGAGVAAACAPVAAPAAAPLASAAGLRSPLVPKAVAVADFDFVDRPMMTGELFVVQLMVGEL